MLQTVRGLRRPRSSLFHPDRALARRGECLAPKAWRHPLWSTSREIFTYAHLFGILWPLGDTVKLDTSVNRSLFRRQKERIKALGYAFQASGQRWVRA